MGYATPSKHKRKGGGGKQRKHATCTLPLLFPRLHWCASDMGLPASPLFLLELFSSELQLSLEAGVELSGLGHVLPPLLLLLRLRRDQERTRSPTFFFCLSTVEAVVGRTANSFLPTVLVVVVGRSRCHASKIGNKSGEEVGASRTTLTPTVTVTRRLAADYACSTSGER